MSSESLKGCGDFAWVDYAGDPSGRQKAGRGLSSDMVKDVCCVESAADPLGARGVATESQVFMLKARPIHWTDRRLLYELLTESKEKLVYAPVILRTTGEYCSGSCDIVAGISLRSSLIHWTPGRRPIARHRSAFSTEEGGVTS
jgi:hypothetical protein